jgi:hypothetical protein
MHPVHTFPPYFPKTHFNIILPPTPSYFEWSLPYRYSDQNLVRISYLSLACLSPRTCVTFRNLFNFVSGSEVVKPLHPPKPQAKRPPLFGCSLLLIRHYSQLRSTSEGRTTCKLQQWYIFSLHTRAHAHTHNT